MGKRVKSSVILLAVIYVLAASGFAKEFRVLSGNPQDVNPKLHGPVINLEGGGTPAKGGLQNTIDRVRGCATCKALVDIVVLAWAPADVSLAQSSAFLNEGIRRLPGVDSVETIFVLGREPISDGAFASISQAEVVFISGGQQCDYTNNFRGKVEQAAEIVYGRGGGIVGTSAGTAILGEFIFDGCGVTKKPMTSEDALNDPYASTITFTYDLFSFRFLKDTITDQHFVKRDRMGRTLAFLARQLQDGKAKKAHAIAVDEATSVIVDKGGIATVVGSSPVVATTPDGKQKLTLYDGENAAYFITADHKPEVCSRGEPLTYSNFKVWKVQPGGTFNLSKRPQSGFYTVSVTQGKLSHRTY